jgi:predicted ATPase/DNA-binding winged helix-turn-helix (wHTH) protein
MTPAAQTRDVISFGPFSLIAGERLLTRDGVPVELGARALDVLIALVSRPNEVVGKKDLLDRVWPDVTVEESSLRFALAGLRKALGDGQNGARYITTLAGRGYCFVAPISRSGPPRPVETTPVVSFPHVNLPGRLTRMVGRDDDVLRIAKQLAASRLVTIVGSGGIGKTTAAIATGHHLLDTFSGAVLFVDLAMLSDPNLVATAAASMLGLSVQSSDATPSLIAHLRDMRILLILDTCEHLIETVAVLVANLFDSAPQVHILATSREALQVDGEHVYRLEPLACPPDGETPTADAAQAFPATRLFLERAAASGAHLELSDAEAAIVVAICRKLDGVALAIELAARRVEAYGLAQTSALLDQRLTLLWGGPRTAPPRQKTLQATLDWSYGLLSDLERLVLCRLAVFVGHFTLDAALAVVTSETIDQADVFSAIDSLVAKSMVATRPIGAMMRYRLLDTTRAYALEIAIDDAERTDLAVRHANYFRRWLEQNGTDWSTLTTGTERAPHFAGLNNVRAALEWCFGAGGNTEVGVALAAAAAPVFLMMSLLPECHRWSEHALRGLDDAARGGVEEMHLQAALGVSSMFTRGNSEAARAALNRSLSIAQAHGDAPKQLQLLGLLHMFHHRIADFKATLHYARQCKTVSDTVAVPAAAALAHCLLGSSLHHGGDISGARAELEAALRLGTGHARARTIYLDFEHYNYADIALARTLWLQGYPVQAMARAHCSVADAASKSHPVPLSRALVWAISVFLWAGDLDGADDHTDRLAAHAQSHSLGPYLAVAQGYKGALAVCRGDAGSGVARLQSAIEAMHATRYELLTTTFNIWLAQGLAATGQLADGLARIDATIDLVEENGDLSQMPELLRVKGGLLLAAPLLDMLGAETCLEKSFELSHRQGARAWELRAATDLAKLLADRGEPNLARGRLQPVFDAFTEGFDTTDLKAAKALLEDLAQS